jgi:hypothetical protein
MSTAQATRAPTQWHLCPRLGPRHSRSQLKVSTRRLKDAGPQGRNSNSTTRAWRRLKREARSAIATTMRWQCQIALGHRRCHTSHGQRPSAAGRRDSARRNADEEPPVGCRRCLPLCTDRSARAASCPRNAEGGGGGMCDLANENDFVRRVTEVCSLQIADCTL